MSLLERLKGSRSPSPLAIFVAGPCADGTAEVAAAIRQAFCERDDNTFIESASQIADDVMLRWGMTTQWQDTSNCNLADMDFALPFDAASDLFEKMMSTDRLAVLFEPNIHKLMPFWIEAARRAGVVTSAVLVMTPPVEAASDADRLLEWLRSVLLTERSTRDLPRTFTGIEGSDDPVAWVAAISGLKRAKNACPDLKHASVYPFFAYAPETGFNSWVRRCYSAIAQLARQGDNAQAYRELDQLQAHVDAALALFTPILTARNLEIEKLQTANAGMIDVDRLQESGGLANIPEVASEAAAACERESILNAELASALHEIALLRAWGDTTGPQLSQTRAELLAARLKLGQANISNERMAGIITASGERQIRSIGRPFARWLERRGWAYKAARRLERYSEIVEDFLDGLPWPIVGQHPEGRRRRILAYLLGVTDFLADFPLVRDLEYEEMYPDTVASGLRPLVHFILFGQNELRNPHPLFNTNYYLEQCPESTALASSAAVHYLKWGKEKGHDPHPLFSTKDYLARYPDVAVSGRNPLLHWIDHFRITANSLFDAQYYLDTYPDVADAGRNPLTHYLNIGWRERRNPNPWFDTGYFLAAHPKYATDDTDPLTAYVRTGWRERLRPSPQFDPIFYLENDPGLSTDCDPLRHYIEHGHAEGRPTVPNTSASLEILHPEITQVPIDPPVSTTSTQQKMEDLVGLPSSNDVVLRRVVLMIEALYPRPDLDSGSLDHLNFAKIFQRMGYDVHYLSLLEFGRDHDELSGYYRKLMSDMGVYCVTNADYPYFEGYYFDLQDRIDICFISRVHFGGMQMESIRRLCPNAFVIFNTVDLHFVREEREGALKKDPAILLRAHQTREIELAFAEEADATIVVSSSEKALLEDLAPSANVHVVPLIREFSARNNKAFEQRSDIAFVGGFNHQPNVDAVEHFLVNIWPSVHRRRPDIRFRVIGANMPQDWKARICPGVTFVGYVENLEDELHRLRLTVAPLRYGAGAKGKLVSSLAAGVPAVVSTIAAEGMGLIDGEVVLSADTNEHFVAKIIELYDDSELWKRLSSNGADFIRQNYSIDKGYEILQRIIPYRLQS